MYDLMLASIVVVSAYQAMNQGFLAAVASVLPWLFAFICAAAAPAMLSPFVQGHIGSSLAGVIALGLSYFLIRSFGLGRRRMRWLEVIGGGLFGAVRGLLIVPAFFAVGSYFADLSIPLDLGNSWAYVVGDVFLRQLFHLFLQLGPTYSLLITLAVCLGLSLLSPAFKKVFGEFAKTNRARGANFS